MKLCECGCGEPVPIASRNRKPFGWTKGRPIRFIKGHHLRCNKIKHGQAKKGLKTKIYRIWCNMLSRCENTQLPSYENYGARGINVCNRWHSFEAFFVDMGNPPTIKHTIDRINNDGPYSPENCRWATRKEQMSNRRYRKDSHWIEFNGHRKILTQWAKDLNINIQTLWSRIRIQKWNIERALTTPVIRR